jgi:SAM-dependent methyltransferase
MTTVENNKVAQTLAGRAVLLEVGARLGVLDPLLARPEVSVAEVAKECGVKRSLVNAYYEALSKVGLTEARGAGNDDARFAGSAGLPAAINDAGYILWGVMSCAPLLANARRFADDMHAAADTYHRDGEHVARTSKWMGEQDFYPHAERAILAARPRKIVDLGAGTCGLLIRCLNQLPEAVGVGIDMNHDACVEARAIVDKAGMGKRIGVIEAPIQKLIEDPTPLEGADVIHAGFVFHDLMPDEEKTLDALLKVCRQRARGTLIVVDAIPYGQIGGEEAFSACFTFLHHHFMARRLQPESEWTNRLTAAGYESVEVSRLGISGGRIFTARSKRN